MTGRHAAPKPRKREYEDDDFAKALGRFIDAMGRRADTNPDALGYMLLMHERMGERIDEAGYSLTNAGWSSNFLAMSATQAGKPMTRQNVTKRWGAAAQLRKQSVRMGVAEVINLAAHRLRKLREQTPAAQQRAALRAVGE
jgi:hypothetical protein